MLVSTFPTLHEALVEILPLDKEYRLIIHQLTAGTMIAPHYHDIAHEWVLVDARGKINVFYGAHQSELVLENGAVTVIHFPPTSIHGLETTTPIRYFVIRSSADVTHYV